MDGNAAGGSRNIPGVPLGEDRVDVEKLHRLLKTEGRQLGARIDIDLKIKVLDCVIGRRRVTIQPSHCSLAQTIILKPIRHPLSTLNFLFFFPALDTVLTPDLLVPDLYQLLLFVEFRQSGQELLLSECAILAGLHE